MPSLVSSLRQYQAVTNVKSILLLGPETCLWIKVLNVSEIFGLGKSSKSLSQHQTYCQYQAVVRHKTSLVASRSPYLIPVLNRYYCLDQTQAFASRYSRLRKSLPQANHQKCYYVFELLYHQLRDCIGEPK